MMAKLQENDTSPAFGRAIPNDEDLYSVHLYHTQKELHYVEVRPRTHAGV
jgi:hypothetical protein